MTKEEARTFIERFEAVEEVNRRERLRGRRPSVADGLRTMFDLADFAAALAPGTASDEQRQAGVAQVRAAWARLRERLA